MHRISLLLAAILVSCSVQQPPAPGPANPRLSAGASTGSVSRVDAQAPAPLVALDSLRPLISRAELSEVAVAVERGDVVKALLAFEQALVRANPQSPERQRWHLWLGYAYQKRDDCAAAISHFDEASSVAWPLVDYARFGAAQCRVALGLLKEAGSILDSAKSEAPLEDSVNLLRAQISFQTGSLGQAINIWRDYLQKLKGGTSESAKVSLSLAQALYSAASQEFHTEPLNPRLVPDNISTDSLLREALSRLDSTNIRDLDGAAQERAVDLKQSIVARIFSTDPNQQQKCKIGDQIDELENLVEQRDIKRAFGLASSLLAELQQAGLQRSSVGCRALFAAAQIHLARGENREACARYDTVAKECNDPEDLVARALFAAGRRWQDFHDAPVAIAHFESLEKRFPTHRLADDARLRQAYAYLELGADSKFTDLIEHMTEDFPNGDMVGEGLFQLALRRIVKGDWSGAEPLLSQAGRLRQIVERDDVEQTERQKYFLARAQYQLGQREPALVSLEQLVRERPFSYYMLEAYTRLIQWAPERAERAKALANTGGKDSPFTVSYRSEFDRPGFARAIELMALGEFDKGAEELKMLHLPTDIEPQLFWTQASFEAAAGALKDSQALVKDRMRDWPRRWPVGAWEAAWKVGFPQPFLDIVLRESKRANVPKSLVYAVIREESQFDRNALSGAEAYGLMQLIVPTARIAARKLEMVANSVSLMRPNVNIALGCQVLAGLLQQFEGQPTLAIPAYNAGPGRPARWLKERPDMDFDVWVEAIPFTETRTYFKHVLSSWATYTWLYERDISEATMRLPLRIGN